jgi:hypothetical protein
MKRSSELLPAFQDSGAFAERTAHFGERGAMQIDHATAEPRAVCRRQDPIEAHRDTDIGARHVIQSAHSDPRTASPVDNVLLANLPWIIVAANHGDQIEILVAHKEIETFARGRERPHQDSTGRLFRSHYCGFAFQKQRPT